MPEIIDFDHLESNSPAHFVLMAITACRDFKFPDRDHGPTKVSLIVNEQELPFKSVIEDLYRRINAEVDERAAKMALEMITESGLNGVLEALREAEGKVRDALVFAGLNPKE